MIELSVPGVGQYRLAHLVLDVNGTISVDGELIEGVVERVQQLADRLEIHLLTVDTRGSAGALAKRLGVACTRVERGHEAQQKRDFVDALGAEGVIAIGNGNGNNDEAMLARAGLGIAVMGPEGTALRALVASDVVTRSIADALDLVRDPTRLLATLRC